MASEFEIHSGKRGDKTYISPRFTSKNPLTEEEVPIRKISKVFDVKDCHFFEYLKEYKTVVLRKTASEREEIILTVLEDTNEVRGGVSIQRYSTKTGYPIKESLFFHPEEFKKMLDFLYSIKFIDFPDEKHFSRMDSEIVRGAEDFHGFARKFSDLSKEQREAILADETLKWADFVNLAFRNEWLKLFRQWMGEWMDDEKRWQEFFQEHSWIFGYGLDYRFMAIFDREMSVWDGGTEDQNKPKTDILGEYTDFTVLVELKTPLTHLFDTWGERAKKNRAGCWKLGNDLIDAYSQILEQKAEWSIKWDRGNNLSKDGSKRVNARTRDPKVILVIGNKADQIANIENITERELKQDTFELFRRDSRNVEILTYDELLERAEFIVSHKISA